jgi:hypothetical protein
MRGVNSLHSKIERATKAEGPLEHSRLFLVDLRHGAGFSGP